MSICEYLLMNYDIPSEYRSIVIKDTIHNNQLNRKNEFIESKLSARKRSKSVRKLFKISDGASPDLP